MSVRREQDKVYVGSVGFEIRFDLVDADYTALDLSTFSYGWVEVTKPGGTTTTWALTKDESTTTGRVVYATTTSADFNVAGWYQLIPYIVFSDGDQIYGTEQRLKVSALFG